MRKTALEFRMDSGKPSQLKSDLSFDIQAFQPSAVLPSTTQLNEFIVKKGKEEEKWYNVR